MKKQIIFIIMLMIHYICNGEVNKSEIKSITILCSKFEYYSIKDANLEITLINNNESRLVDFKPSDSDSTLFDNSKALIDCLFYNVITDSIVIEKIASKISEVKEFYPIDSSSIESNLLCIIWKNDDTIDYINYDSHYYSMIINGNVMELDKDILKLFFPYMPESFRETFIMFFGLEND